MTQRNKSKFTSVLSTDPNGTLRHSRTAMTQSAITISPSTVLPSSATPIATSDADTPTCVLPPYPDFRDSPAPRAIKATTTSPEVDAADVHDASMPQPLASSTPSSSSMSNNAHIDGGVGGTLVTSPGTTRGSSSGTKMTPAPPMPLPSAAALLALSRGRQQRSNRSSYHFHPAASLALPPSMISSSYLPPSSTHHPQPHRYSFHSSLSTESDAVVLGRRGVVGDVIGEVTCDDVNDDVSFDVISHGDDVVDDRDSACESTRPTFLVCSFERSLVWFLWFSTPYSSHLESGD